MPARTTGWRLGRQHSAVCGGWTTLERQHGHTVAGAADGRTSLTRPAQRAMITPQGLRGLRWQPQQRVRGPAGRDARTLPQPPRCSSLPACLPGEASPARSRHAAPSTATTPWRRASCVAHNASLHERTHARHARPEQPDRNTPRTTGPTKTHRPPGTRVAAQTGAATMSGRRHTTCHSTLLVHTLLVVVASGSAPYTHLTTQRRTGSAAASGARCARRRQRQHRRHPSATTIVWGCHRQHSRERTHHHRLPPVAVPAAGSKAARPPMC
jgi:hypothetical protein